MTNEQEMREYVLNLIDADIKEFQTFIDLYRTPWEGQSKNKSLGEQKLLQLQRHRSEFLKMCEQNDANTKK